MLCSIGYAAEAPLNTASDPDSDEDQYSAALQADRECERVLIDLGGAAKAADGCAKLRRLAHRILEAAGCAADWPQDAADAEGCDQLPGIVAATFIQLLQALGVPCGPSQLLSVALLPWLPRVRSLEEVAILGWAEAGHPIDLGASAWDATTCSHSAQRSLQRSLGAADRARLDELRMAATEAAAAESAARLQRLRLLAAENAAIEADVATGKQARPGKGAPAHTPKSWR
jgi:hypothetical protein